MRYVYQDYIISIKGDVWSHKNSFTCHFSLKCLYVKRNTHFLYAYQIKYLISIHFKFNTGPRFIYVSSAGRVGCKFMHLAQPTDALSSRRSSRSHIYTPGFPRGLVSLFTILRLDSVTVSVV
jgi:hypothetical protein